MSVEFWVATGGLDEVLDLLARNEHFPQRFARGKQPAPDEPPHAFCAAIKGCRRLVDVIKQGSRQRLFGLVYR